MSYDVHLFVSVRVKVPNVEAENMAQAIEAAAEQVWPDLHNLIDREYAEGTKPIEAIEFQDSEQLQYALVDVVGDTEYERSCWFEKNAAGQLVPGANQKPDLPEEVAP